MSMLKSIQEYHSLFGWRGVWLAAQASLRQRSMKLAVVVPGIKHPVHVRLRTSDISTFKQVLATSGYDCSFVRAPRFILDAGANIGLTSVFYANRYPEAKIIAIEPEPSNYKLLVENAAPYPGITPLLKALWKDNQELRIVDPGLGGWAFQTAVAARPEVVNCPNQGKTCGVSVDMILKEYGISYVDLLKVDIEGAEKEVFESAGAWIDKVGTIAIELHDGIKPGCGAAFEDATKDFKILCRRAETLFVARSGHMSDDQAAGQSAELLKGNGATGPKPGLSGRIVGAWWC